MSGISSNVMSSKGLSETPPEQLIGVYPLLWRSDDRNDAWERVIDASDDTQEDSLYPLRNTYVYPPFVANKLFDLLLYADPKVVRFATTDADPDVVHQRFLAKVSQDNDGIVPATILASGVLMPGTCPTNLLAKAVSLDPDVFTEYLESYPSTARLTVQIGRYITEIARGDNSETVKLGQTWRLSKGGRKLWEFIRSNYLEPFTDEQLQTGR